MGVSAKASESGAPGLRGLSGDRGERSHRDQGGGQDACRAAESYCVLMTDSKKPLTPEAEERLAAMVKTTNGFEIAELDLRLRGPGEFFGTRQAGMPDFRVANLLRDRELLEVAKREAAWVT